MGHCKDCIFFKRGAYVDDYGARHNECHRYPKNAEINGYPDVSLFDWCGEFSPKIGAIKRAPMPRDPMPEGIFEGWKNEC